MAQPSWATRGFEEGEKQIVETSTAFTREFFLKNSKEQAVVRVLDPETWNIRSHFNKKDNTWYTCIQGEENCPFCERGIKANNQFILQVLDKRVMTDKNGNEHTNEVKIWRTGARVFRALSAFKGKYGDLTTLDLEVTRLGVGKQTQYQILPENFNSEQDMAEIELYNLEEILQPKTRLELLQVLGEDDGDDDDGDEEAKPTPAADAIPW
jgi:hypothetical protein